MKFGLVLPMFSDDAGKVRETAAVAEELGFDGVFASDHLLGPGHPDRPSAEAFTMLTAIGVARAGLEVGTLVARAGLRHPGLLAKMAASVDDMTGGRFILGAGAGDASDEREHGAFGLNEGLGIEERRALLAETVQAVKSLFDGQGWEGGEHTPEIPGPLLPPPARPGGPPVWIGGVSDETVRLAARFADGWNGWGLTADAFAQKARLLAAQAGEAGRRCDATWAGIVAVGRDDAEASRLAEARREKGLPQVWTGSADALTGFARGLRDAGAAWCILMVTPADRVEMVARSVLPEVRR